MAKKEKKEKAPKLLKRIAFAQANGEAIAKLWNAGEKPSAIVKKMKCPPPSLYYTLNYMGLLKTPGYGEIFEADKKKFNLPEPKFTPVDREVRVSLKVVEKVKKAVKAEKKVKAVKRVKKVEVEVPAAEVKPVGVETEIPLSVKR